MLETLDIATVRRFTEDQRLQIQACDNGEGFFCNTLEHSIRRYCDLLSKSRQTIDQWARAIFSGEISFDSEVEALFRDQTRSLLTQAEKVAARGRTSENTCCEVLGLVELHRRTADLNYLMKNWVSPKRSVSPAARVAMPSDAHDQILDRLQKLEPLPEGWLPSDPEQLAFYRTHCEKRSS